MIELLGNNQISWTAINRGLQQHIENLRQKIVNDELGQIEKDTTFYSFLVGKTLNRKATAPMCNFFESTCKQLLQRLTTSEVSHLHRMIKLFLTNYDYKYLNFIGELAVLNAYKSTGDYELINIEEKAYDQNNVMADLLIERKNDGLKFLVEIVNIHLERKSLTTNSQIKLHIANKIQEKIKKTFFDSPRKSIFLQPVIWTEDLKQLKSLAKLYKSRKSLPDKVFIPMSYLTYKLEDGSYEHRFEYVNTILKENSSSIGFLERLRILFLGFLGKRTKTQQAL